MIKKLRVRNYRSCLDTELILQRGLSVLIGPNGTGKTTLLRALMLLRSLASGPGVHRGRMRPDEEVLANEAKLRVEFECKGKKLILHGDVSLLVEDDNSDVVLAAKESWYAKDFTGSAKRLRVPLWALEHRMGGYQQELRYRMGYGPKLSEPVRGALQSVAAFVSGMRYYSATQFTDPARCPVSFEVEQRGRHLSSTKYNPHRHTQFLIDLYRARGTDEFAEFMGVVGAGGIGLLDDIEFQEVRASSVDYKVHSGGKVRTIKREKVLVVPQFLLGSGRLSPSQLSEGTFKTITLLFYLMTEQSTALLIEEPEVCVHQGLLASIVELIREYSKEKQIILSTHSDYVLDHVDAESVYMVRRDVDGGTQVAQVTRSLSVQELAALRMYLDTEGNLGEYWRHGGLD